jgi:hypothetical protein
LGGKKEKKKEIGGEDYEKSVAAERKRKKEGKDFELNGIVKVGVFSEGTNWRGLAACRVGLGWVWFGRWRLKGKR